MNRRIRQRTSRALAGLAATGALVVPILVGTSAAGAQDNPSVPAGCAGPERQLVWDVYEELGSAIDVASLGPEREIVRATAPMLLGPGDYRLYSVSADDHVGPTFHHQPHEQYFVTLGGVRTPGMMPDLPDRDMWQTDQSFPDDDGDLRTMPADVAADLPGFDLGVLTIDQATADVGFHHRSTLGEELVLATEVNSVLPMVVTFECLHPDLALTKTVDGQDRDGTYNKTAEVAYGTPFSWQIVIVNSGAGRATGVIVEDVLPSGLELVAGSAAAGLGTVAETPDGVTWTGDLLAGESVTLNFETVMADIDAFTSCADSDSDGSDTRCTNRARIVELEQYDDPIDNDDDASITPAPLPEHFEEETVVPHADPLPSAPDAPAPPDTTAPAAPTTAPSPSPAPPTTAFPTPLDTTPATEASPPPAPAPPALVPSASAPPMLPRTGASVGHGLAGFLLIMVGAVCLQFRRVFDDSDNDPALG